MNVKILKPFRDIHTKEVYAAGDVLEMDETRIAEAEENLAKHGGSFLETVDEQEPGAEKKPARKARE